MKALEFATVGGRNARSADLLPITDSVDAIVELADFLEMAWVDGAVITDSYKQPNTYAIHWRNKSPFENGNVLRVRVVEVGQEMPPYRPEEKQGS